MTSIESVSFSVPFGKWNVTLPLLFVFFVWLCSFTCRFGFGPCSGWYVFLKCALYSSAVMFMLRFFVVVVSCIWSFSVIYRFLFPGVFAFIVRLLFSSVWFIVSPFVCSIISSRLSVGTSYSGLFASMVVV